MMKHFFAAVQFLTICPLPASIKIGEPELGRSVTYFPVVGILLGAATACLDYGLSYVLPLPVASTLAVIFMIAVSGALHMDGLADTADGFFSSRPRPQMLDIMRDSRTGPMGVIAIVCVLILKITLLTSVPQTARWWVLLLTPFAGRSALLVTMAVIPYARPEGGLAAVFYAHRSRYYLVWVMIALAVVGWLVGGWAGLTAGLASFVFGLLFAVYVHAKIGGFTGDTLGAACELAELIPAMVCVIWIYRGLAII